MNCTKPETTCFNADGMVSFAAVIWRGGDRGAGQEADEERAGNWIPKVVGTGRNREKAHFQ